MTPTSVKVQIVPESVPSTPSWLGEVTMIAHVFIHYEVIAAIEERVRFARARFGHFELIDFVAVLLGYAVSGERTLEEYYERVRPFASVFMALFGRERLPSHSALSRYLSALDEPVVEELRTLFQQDLVARKPSGGSLGGLRDREGKHWVVIDVDGTKQVARQRALPQALELPPAHRRMNAVCAPGYPGRKRGEVMRTRTTVLQAHTDEWLGTFGNAGNGDYRSELLRAIQAIVSYAQALSLPLSTLLVRLDGLYGDPAPLIDLLTSGLGVIVRGKNYALLDLPVIEARLSQPPDEVSTHPESGTTRALFDFVDVPLTPAGPRVRMIVATHPVTATPAAIGVTKNGLVCEIFLTTVPPQALMPSDVLDLYLHRGSFETVLSQEDQEQDCDRWVSHTPCGQEFWQILAQWIWNIRLELGQHLTLVPMRLTEFAPARVVASTPTPVSAVALTPLDRSAPITGLAHAPWPASYGPPRFARPSHIGGFAGSAFAFQPDGTLLCPADHPLYPQERRLEHNGSLRVVYAARIAHCSSCPLREQCQRQGSQTVKPRRISALFEPLSSHDELASPSIDPPSLSDEPPSVETSSLPAESASSSQDGALAPVFATASPLAQAPWPASYGPPHFVCPSYSTGFAGSAFALQPDGTLLCPADHTLSPQVRRLKHNGSLRVVYAAQIAHCGSCPLREQCQGQGFQTVEPRRVSAIFEPLSSHDESASPSVEPPSLSDEPPSVEPSSLPDGSVPPSLEASLLPDGSVPPSLEASSLSDEPPSVEPSSLPDESASSSVEASSLPDGSVSPVSSLSDESVPPSLEPPSSPTPCPVLWEDWPACSIRRKWMHLLHTETVLLTMGPAHTEACTNGTEPVVLTRAERAHWRMSWSQRLVRNGRGATAPPLEITLHGLPASFASAFALNLATAA